MPPLHATVVTISKKSTLTLHMLNKLLPYCDQIYQREKTYNIN